MSKLIVLAIGGNSLIKDPKHITVRDQYLACVETCRHIVGMIKHGYKLVITHGNGPQVGFILRRGELAKHELHMVPLDSCGADTQGAIGYNLQMAIHNALREAGIHKPVATVVTQVVVSADDPSFKNPSKPIGSFMDEKIAREHQLKDGWAIVEDAGRGFRRVVPSPRPLEIIELEPIQHLVERDVITIAVGGGGIPVVRKSNGELEGVEAVIDKDLASCLLAKTLGADIFIISTAIDKVYVNYNKPNQRGLDTLTVQEATDLIHEGHFEKGSMLPKIQAAVDFVKATNGRVIITNPENLEKAIAGQAGTALISE